MLRKILLPLIFLGFFIPSAVFARITPEDIYQAKRAEYEKNLLTIEDPLKKQAIQNSDQLLKEINLQVCSRFDIDVAKMAAILEEEKARQHITATVVAYGQGDTPLDTAAYYVNFAAEAVAYQKIQDYTPQIQKNNLGKSVSISKANLKASLQTLQGKIIRAKKETQKAIDYYEK